MASVSEAPTSPEEAAPTLLLTIFLTVLSTLLVVLAWLNLTAAEPRVQHQVEHLFGVDDPQFARTMGALLAPNFIEGNDIVSLENGDTYFPIMVQAIRDAKESVNLETFIFWHGDVGEKFAAALEERAQAGCHVHVLLDWCGSFKAPRWLIRRMEKSGVHVAMFRPPKLMSLASFNNRTHRKILVIDGRLGFTGGTGIADAWKGRARNKGQWRDSMYQLRGPIVGQLQAAFMDNWLQTRATVLHGERYFPELERCGPTRAHIFTSGPGEGSEGARLMYLLSITCATKRILLAHAYFVPDDLCVAALVEARMRGVHVEIIIPGATDSPVTKAAMHSRLGPLLSSGVRVYEYQRAMFHRKAMVIDDCWTSVGSCNFDTRSFRINDEVILNAWDRPWAEYMAGIHGADRKCSRELTRAEHEARTAVRKGLEWSAGLLRSQL